MNKRWLLGFLPFPLLSSCGEDEPSLRTVMYRVDAGDRALERSLKEGDLTELDRHFESVRTGLLDPALQRYVEKATFRGDPARFEAQRRATLAVLDELSAKVAASDTAGAQMLYPKLRASCETCHIAFRPAGRLR